MTADQKNSLFYKELGAWIRNRRDRLGLSLERVAKDSDCGLSRSTLSLIELGEQQIYGRQLFEVAKILGFSVDDAFKVVNEAILKEEHPDIKDMI